MTHARHSLAFRVVDNLRNKKDNSTTHCEVKTAVKNRQRSYGIQSVGNAMIEANFLVILIWA